MEKFQHLLQQLQSKDDQTLKLMAKTSWKLYNELINAGFNKEQALQVLLASINKYGDLLK